MQCNRSESERTFVADEAQVGNNPTGDFRAVLSEHLRGRTVLKLVLSRKKRGATEPAERVTVRPVQLAAGEAYQFASRANGQETHENLPAAAAAERVLTLFGQSFLDCHLYTPERDYAARIRRGDAISVKKSSPTQQAAATAHDRTKAHIIPEGVPCPFLAEIGVMTASGKVRAPHRKKFRQINRFLELVDDVVASLPATGVLRVVDFGCGKSSLTFALHHLLTKVHGRDVDILGLDVKADVIHDCRRIAERLAPRGLEFRVGHIADLEVDFKVDLAVSLHACDTATDDALAKAVAWNADVILAGPCCQHELFNQIDAPQLAPLLTHGILKERFAALATDALRAVALEACGYRTQVVEFIDMEHTAKNVLLRAVRPEPGEARTAGHVKSFAEFKAFLGVTRLSIETALQGLRLAE